MNKEKELIDLIERSIILKPFEKRDIFKRVTTNGKFKAKRKLKEILEWSKFKKEINEILKDKRKK